MRGLLWLVWERDGEYRGGLAAVEEGGRARQTRMMAVLLMIDKFVISESL
jgi:hypothetical protein